MYNDKVFSSTYIQNVSVKWHASNSDVAKSEYLLLLAVISINSQNI